MKNFVSSNQVWYRMRERPIYGVLTVLILLFITVTISLCIYVMIKHRSGSSSRRFDDDYEYTRLNDPSFELTHNSSCKLTSIKISIIFLFMFCLTKFSDEF